MCNLNLFFFFSKVHFKYVLDHPVPHIQSMKELAAVQKLTLSSDNAICRSCS